VLVLNEASKTCNLNDSSKKSAVCPIPIGPIASHRPIASGHPKFGQKSPALQRQQRRDDQLFFSQNNSEIRTERDSDVDAKDNVGFESVVFDVVVDPKSDWRSEKRLDQ
jgi:hypothetical protein